MPTIHQTLQRIRQRERIQVRTMAMRLGMTTGEYIALESPEHELTVAELLACQEALDVPLSEFFDVPDPVSPRASILKAYKSALTLKEIAKGHDQQVMVDRLIESLLEVMPEMDGRSRAANQGVKAWQSVGQRRTSDEMGAIAGRVIDTSHLSFVESYGYAI